MKADPAVLDRAADYIEIHGLNQDGWYFKGDRACVLGACGVAADLVHGHSDDASGSYHRMPHSSVINTYSEAIGEFLGLPSSSDDNPFGEGGEFMSVPDWNDHRADQETVINTLRALAQQLRGLTEAA